ncbi:MAG: ABC1 kinase family protein [Solirubrobacterales bacterium]
MKQVLTGLFRSMMIMRLFYRIVLAFAWVKLAGRFRSAAWKQQKHQEMFVRYARLFRETAVKNGGLLIKLGQFFSTRVDILPKAVINELAGLQDEVAGVPFDQVQTVAEKEFGKPLSEIYAEIDPVPVASASLGQVHKARLTSGERVAVKVMRPHIEELVAWDLKNVRRIITILDLITDWGRFIEFDPIYNEFRETIWRELDYINEGKNAETIQANNQDEADLLVPRIHWDYTRRRVLTMEYMEGIKVTDHQGLAAAGVDRKKVANLLLKTYVKQVLVDGFFHADPHPGNLFITPDSRLIMIDFGMVGTIPPNIQDLLIKAALAILKQDYTMVVVYFKRMGFLQLDADNEVVARAVGMVIEHFFGESQDWTDQDLSQFLKDLEQLLYEQPFQIPGNYTFLGRAGGTLYGLCIGLDPQINFMAEIKPYLARFGGGNEGFFAALRSKSTALASAIVEVPPLAERVLRRTERGDLTVKVPMKDTNKSLQRVERAVLVLAWAVVLAAALLSSTALQITGYIQEARFGLGVSGLLFFFLLLQSRSGGKRRRRAPHAPVMVRRDQD